jgi:hypothetical protein
MIFDGLYAYLSDYVVMFLTFIVNLFDFGSNYSSKQMMSIIL